LRRRLAQLGFRIAKRRVLEINIVFDTRDGVLRRGRKLLRLRQAGSRQTITFKGPPSGGRHKSREEIESDLNDGAVLRLILERLGFAPVFRYEKYRTEYAKPRQSGSVTLDETPIGDFVELEGSPRWIDRTARALGWSPADYITASYGALYLARCRAKGVRPGNMVFRRHRS
jgi:adenylate cyclase, class 2